MCTGERWEVPTLRDICIYGNNSIPKQIQRSFQLANFSVILKRACMYGRTCSMKLKKVMTNPVQLNVRLRLSHCTKYCKSGLQKNILYINTCVVNYDENDCIDNGAAVTIADQVLLLIVSK